MERFDGDGSDFRLYDGEASAGGGSGDSNQSDEGGNIIRYPPSYNNDYGGQTGTGGADYGSDSGGLVRLGETDPLFESIEVYSTTEPKQILWDNRTLRAAVAGAVIALSAALIAAAFYYVMDDSVYVAADVEGRYGIPAIGILAEGNGKWTERFDAELVANCRYLGRNMEKLALVGVDVKEDAEKAGKRMSLLLEQRKGRKRWRFGMRGCRRKIRKFMPGFAKRTVYWWRYASEGKRQGYGTAAGKFAETGL